jgi:hypothetical protein
VLIEKPEACLPAREGDEPPDHKFAYMNALFEKNIFMQLYSHAIVQLIFGNSGTSPNFIL